MKKTADVETLVARVAVNLTVPFSPNAILEVARLIESDSNSMSEYARLCQLLTPPVVNQWIGVYTRDYVGMHAVKVVPVPPKSTTIIQSYSVLG